MSDGFLYYFKFLIDFCVIVGCLIDFCILVNFWLIAEVRLACKSQLHCSWPITFLVAWLLNLYLCLFLYFSLYLFICLFVLFFYMYSVILYWLDWCLHICRFVFCINIFWFGFDWLVNCNFGLHCTLKQIPCWQLAVESIYM